jgi:hypothetical protein
MGYEFLQLYLVNPATLASLRKAFKQSGAKSDLLDRDLLLELLQKHRDRLTRWEPDDVQTRHLALLVQDRREAVNECTRLGEQLLDTLKNYFPAMIDLANELGAKVLNFFFLVRTGRGQDLTDITDRVNKDAEEQGLRRRLADGLFADHVADVVGEPLNEGSKLGVVRRHVEILAVLHRLGAGFLGRIPDADQNRSRSVSRLLRRVGPRVPRRLRHPADLTLRLGCGMRAWAVTADPIRCRGLPVSRSRGAQATHTP